MLATSTDVSTGCMAVVRTVVFDLDFEIIILARKFDYYDRIKVAVLACSMCNFRQVKRPVLIEY